MEAEKRRGRVYDYSPRHGESNKKRGFSAEKTPVEADPGVHHLWLSNGYETRFLRAYIETSKKRETGRSGKIRLIVGALRYGLRGR